MRRKAIWCLTGGVVLVLGFVLIRWAMRNRVEELAERPGVGGSLSRGLGPFAHGDRFLVSDRPGSRLQLLDQGLAAIDSIPAPADVNELSVSRDLSIVAALEYHGLFLINTRTKARKHYALDKMSTEAYLSPDATHLWVSEYPSGVMHRYSVRDVNAERLNTVDLKLEAEKILGLPTLNEIRDFRVAALANDGRTTYLYSAGHAALLIYDWATGRAVGSVPLPDSSYPRFVQSPSGVILAVVSDRLVFVDLKSNSVVADVELKGNGQAGDFNADGDRFYVGHSAPAMFAIPLTHRGGEIDEFDLQGNRLRTWHSSANRITELGCRGPVTWMVDDEGHLRTIRLP